MKQLKSPLSTTMTRWNLDFALCKGQGHLGCGFHAVDFGFFVRGTWIPLDSNRQCDSRFLQLYSRFQSPRFWIPQAAKICCIPESLTFDGNPCRKIHSKTVTVSFILSLPADVLWGSFVTHSFLLHGRPWGRNECVTNEPQRTSAGRLLYPLKKSYK